MISEKNFTKASAATLQAEAQETQRLLKKIVRSNILDVDEVISALSKNQAMLQFAASELHRVSSGPQNNVMHLRNKACRIQMMGTVN